MSLETVAADTSASPAELAASPERAGAPAPVDGGQPGGEAPAQPEQQGAEGAGEGGEQPPKPVPEHRTVQGRISEYQKRARQAELTAAEERGRRLALEEALRAGVQPREDAAPAPAKPSGPPNPKNYPQGEFDVRYGVDLAKYELRLEQEEERERESAAERTAAANAAIAEGKARLDATIAKARELAAGEEGEGFQNAERVLDLAYRRLDQGGLPRHVVDLITESDNALHVAEVLGRKPEQVHESLRDELCFTDLAKLRAMSPLKAAREIAKLDANISRVLASQKRAAPPTPAAPAKPAPQPTPAAMPTAPAKGGPAPFDPNRASHEDYVRWRESGGGAA